MKKEDEEKRRKFLSKGLTKSDLIGIIIEREDAIERLAKTLSDVKNENESKLAEYEKKIRATEAKHDDDMYEMYLRNNEAFLKRFIDKYVPDKLNVKCKGDYGNYFTVSLNWGGREISSDDGQVINYCNPMDE